MSEFGLQSPLVQAKRLDHSNALASQAGVRLGERAFQGHINLRGDASNPVFLDTVASAIKVNLPLQPNTVTNHNEYSAFWLGPDEWLLIVPAGQQTDLIAQLRTGLARNLAAVTDLSSGQTIMTVSGCHAREVLAKGCPLDLHPRVFIPGHCAQTVVAKANVLLWLLAEDSFELVVRRSFADYLWQWLEDAALEYGFTVV